MILTHLLPERLHAYRPARQLGWPALLLLFWITSTISYVLLGPGYLSHWSIFAGVTLSSLSVGLGCYLLLALVRRYIVRRYPDLSQTFPRVTLLLLSYMLITTSFLSVTLWGYLHWRWFAYVYQPGSATRLLLLNLIINLLAVGVFESSYSLGRWRASTVEKEQLKKINLQSQYESLKQQVNPHFLFNTLNSLSSLIADEPERAEEFVDEMAKVYRYLLQTNRQTDGAGELTTLATEMSFIRSYFHLLKTRYGPGIRLEVALDESDLDYLLPPITLQMLVENAVKHNVIHVHKPLIIEIRSAPGGRLLIQNNLQRKTTRGLSNQVGLSNITAKYRLLAGHRPNLDPAGFTVAQTDAYFTVILPLINPDAS
ncbi:sensor histidine kinase [Fibrella forsythiae]|uniref:Histidine kinase n=1 Tax=Fibrella forsythiae TaxID=2817061 RepID=A0ABS3JR85_9BACT|nr:histidine kinase [Fibrella forsythiae]MBO0952520.1 histidine kinase [Fibrella forsythiae]